MRELGLYRAKDAVFAEWVYGNLIRPPQVEHYTDWACILPFKTDCYDAFECVRIEVNPTTICEYTGRLDYSGKKLFELDIIENSHGIELIFWHKKRAAFYRMGELGRIYTIPLQAEAIGNIKGNFIDTPDLLSVEFQSLVREVLGGN